MNDLLEPFDRLLADASTPAVIRAIEKGGSADVLWDAIAASGYLDALVPEAAGGAGLSLADICPLLMALGRHAVPLPVGETMLARALLAGARIPAPQGPIAFETAPGSPFNACESAHVLADDGMTLTLVGQPFTRPEGGLRPIAAIVRACAIAGAADHLLEMTVAYANERVQFGKPIGRQQALQQNLAVMAEQTVACRLAAQTGCAGGYPPPFRAAALAKMMTSAAAPLIANTAHAVHGAIGISAEHDVQLYTRRLHAWRLADGSESWWAEQLGADRLGDAGPSADYVRGIAG